MIWTAISSIIPWEWLAGAVAVVGGLGLAWWRGRRSGAVARDLKAAKAETKTFKELRSHERDAETQDDPALIDRLTRR